MARAPASPPRPRAGHAEHPAVVHRTPSSTRRRAAPPPTVRQLLRRDVTPRSVGCDEEHRCGPVRRRRPRGTREQVGRSARGRRAPLSSRPTAATARAAALGARRRRRRIDAVLLGQGGGEHHRAVPGRSGPPVLLVRGAERGDRARAEHERRKVGQRRRRPGRPRRAPSTARESPGPRRQAARAARRRARRPRRGRPTAAPALVRARRGSSCASPAISVCASVSEKSMTVLLELKVNGGRRAARARPPR